LDIEKGNEDISTTTITADRPFYTTEVLELVGLLIVWYFTSSFANNLTKSILEENVFPFPLSLTIMQFGFIVLFSAVLFISMPSKFKYETVDFQTLKNILIPLCISQILAQSLTQISIQQVPVSFTHTVKACSPIFAIIFSIYYKFKETYTWPLLLSIAPIIGGVILSSLTEINFTLVGFLSALGSAIIFSWQNAFSKKVFLDKEMDQVNLLYYTSLCAFCILLPWWLIIDCPTVVAHLLSGEATYTNGGLWVLIWLNGICHFGQNIAAFTFMTMVTPLTYTVFNTFKRIFVIVAAIIYFNNKIPFLNGVGIVLAIGGVVLYNKAKYDALKQRDKH